MSAQTRVERGLLMRARRAPRRCHQCRLHHAARRSHAAQAQRPRPATPRVRARARCACKPMSRGKCSPRAENNKTQRVSNAPDLRACAPTMPRACACFNAVARVAFVAPLLRVTLLRRARHVRARAAARAAPACLPR